MKQFTLSVLFFLCCLLNSFAANYYFSTLSGDDSRSSTLAKSPKTPWKTVAKLNSIFSQLQPGDSILFKRGEVFTGGIQITKSGKETLPIILSAYGSGERPIISGFVPATGWVSIGAGIYESAVLSTGATVNMVVINGKHYAMGRYPNASAPNKGYLNFEGHGGNYITDNELPALPAWNGAELVIRTTRWTIERVPITSSTKGKITFASSPSNGLDDGYGYFIQNDLKTLDQLGEWYYNPAVKKLYVYFGNTAPATYNVQVSAINNLIEPKASYVVIDNLTIMGANQFGVFNDWANYKNLTVKNSQILFSGVDGIQLSGRIKFVLENSLIANSNCKAVNLNYNDPNATIRGNTIRNSGIYPGMISNTQAYGILSFSKGLTAEYNNITNTGYAGIRFAGDSNLVKNNFIDTFCIVLDDGSGIYTWTGGQNATYNKRSVVGNIILNGIGASEGTDSPNSYAVEGIYLDDNATNVEVTGNTVANCNNYGLKIHNARSIIVQNNTFYNNGAQFTAEHDNNGSAISNLVVANNKFVSKECAQVTSSLKSMTNDFSSMGRFSGNYYARPLDDNLTISAEYFVAGSSKRKQWYDVKGLQTAYGINQNEGASPVRIKPYALAWVDDYNNKFPLGTFESGSASAYCWSPTNDCSASLANNPALDKRAAKISGKTFGLVAFNCGALDRTKQYIVRFTAIADKETNVEVYFRQANSPWGNISPSQAVKITPLRTEYELLFTYPTTESAGSVIFQTGNENFSYWLDNVKIYEVKATMTDASQYIRFEYNPTKADKKITLESNYLDIKRTPYSGTIVLKPYESIILFKDAQGLPNPSGTSNNFQSKSEGCQILLDWFAVVDDYFSYVELEKSKDGENYTAISKMNRKKSSNLQIFQYLDTEVGAQNFYRMKLVDVDGKIRYSDVIEEQTECNGKSWQIYPNLLTSANAELTIKLYTQMPSVNFTVIDQTGRKVKSFQSETISGWNQINWNLHDLPNGMYYLNNSDLTRKGVLPFVVSKN